MVISEVSLKAGTELLRKLWAYAAYAQGTRNSEVSGFGEVDVNNCVVTVNDNFHMIKQQGGVVGTHLDMGALANLIHHYTETSQNPKKLRFWFHTHPGNVFFSWTDDETIKKLTEWGLDPLVAGVFNEQGESRWAVVRHGQRVLEVDFKVPGEPLSSEELGRAKRVIDPILTVKSTARWAWSGYDDDSWMKSWGFKSRRR